MPIPFLTGLRVLDLSQYIPGPYGSLILADLGAEVIKVEPPGGEPMRGVGPKDEAGVSVWYRMVNGGKTVVEIDLKSDDGKRDFRALVEQLGRLSRILPAGRAGPPRLRPRGAARDEPRHRLLLALRLGA